ncbi:MAG: cytochrome C [Bacteroidetes bacterium]|nr:MAG: cytochrome C [Bacteroidota bacterium]
MLRKIIIVLVLILIIIQFIRPSRNISPGISANDITRHYVVSDTVQKILAVACNDCHSNNTLYPWYTNIQPVGWWMQDHINEGKHDLNFSEFASYEPARAAHKMKELIERVKEKDMPLNSYTWIHKDAILSDGQIQILTGWADSVKKTIIDKNQLPPSNRY